MDSAKVSVIMPLYNRESCMQVTIDSVLVQTFKEWELIIVDDGSTDKSWFIALSYAEMDRRIRVYKRERFPKSGSTCRNIGAQYATSDLFIFLDSDDILEPYCLEQRYKYMNENTSIDMAVFPFILEVNGNIPYRKICPYYSSDTFLERLLSYDIPWQTMAPVWRKSFFYSLNGFNEDFPRLQDLEIFVRALKKVNKKIQIVEDYPPDCVYQAYIKNIPFDTMFQAQALLLEKIAVLLNSNERKLMARFLYVFLNVYYFPNSSFENFKKTNNLINYFYNKNVISFIKFLILNCITVVHLLFCIISKYYKKIYYLSMDLLFTQNQNSHKG